jgi:hypothetical protein
MERIAPLNSASCDLRGIQPCHASIESRREEIKQSGHHQDDERDEEKVIMISWQTVRPNIDGVSTIPEPGLLRGPSYLTVGMECSEYEQHEDLE